MNTVVMLKLYSSDLLGVSSSGSLYVYHQAFSGYWHRLRFSCGLRFSGFGSGFTFLIRSGCGVGSGVGHALGVCVSAGCGLG